MPYITSIERLAKEEGKKEGIQESIVNLLMLRFESVPPELVELLNNLEDIALLKQLLL